MIPDFELGSAHNAKFGRSWFVPSFGEAIVVRSKLGVCHDCKAKPAVNVGAHFMPVDIWSGTDRNDSDRIIHNYIDKDGEFYNEFTKPLCQTCGMRASLKTTKAEIRSKMMSQIGKVEKKDFLGN